MVRKRRKYRKRFACGHRGFGQVCHCCAERRRGKQAQVQRRQRLREAWQAGFAEDPIPLSHLPRQVVQKARSILQRLEQGTGFWQLLGKRLSFDRTLVRLPVGYHYRLLCRMEGNDLTPLEVMSHESYNRIARNRSRP